MTAPAIALRRPWHQRLSQNPLHTPNEVVAWLGAVQAQDYLGAIGMPVDREKTHDYMIERRAT